MSRFFTLQTLHFSSVSFSIRRFLSLILWTSSLFSIFQVVLPMNPYTVYFILLLFLSSPDFLKRLIKIPPCLPACILSGYILLSLTFHPSLFS